MEKAFSIFMLFFAGALLLYAAQFAKAVAVVACAPALSGVVGLFSGSDAHAALALVLGLVVTVWISARIMRSQT